MARLTMSYDAGETNRPVKKQTIGSCLAEAVGRQPGVEALVSRHQGIRESYAQFGDSVERVARALLALGIGKGDRVGIWSPNCAEYAHVQFGCARAGAILVVINPAYRPRELEYALRQSGTRLLITSEAFKTSDYLGMLAEIRDLLPALERVVTIGTRTAGGPMDLAWAEFLSLADRVDIGQLTHREAGLDADDPINIQYTSGTTGNPKGATLTHHNILENGRMLGEIMGYSSQDRVCIPVPLYHCFGMGIGNLGCITSGATIVYPAPSFEPLATLQAIAEERCTSVYGVPTMFIGMLGHPQFAEFDLRSLRTGMMAGSPCPIEVMRRVISDMHAEQVTIAYGMTETAPVSFLTRPSDSIERRVTTVGTVMPHTEAKVVDAVTGEVVPVGTPGEICSRGYLVMKGYWEDPAATTGAIDSERWMHTGDLGTMDDEGYLNIVGRIKDMVIRGGENVFPVEVENVLFQHPAVASAQVIGVPDERLGEELMAWVVFREGRAASEDDLRAFCRERMAHFKVPKYFKFTDEFPMTVTGKVQKFKMREAAVAELGLERAASVRTA
ncbi:MAG TPA: AMP-binding protein [Tepidiformaceae bacterium]|nr:AMP-binding protein [Tepidiformaceae bacterium]